MTTYDGVPYEKWVEELTAMDKWNVRHILSAFSLFDIPYSYLDIGCGDGIMVRIARRLGSLAFGVDQLIDENYPEYFYHKNLVDYFELPQGQVDFITCFEVAEHIHESAHATLCDTICKNLKEGVDKYLLFSAARPGQNGTGHISCRSSNYWAEEFILRGLTADDPKTMNLALLWSKIKSPLGHLSDNLMVFHKGGTT
jgi:SAM-dependent methyltransferase